MSLASLFRRVSLIALSIALVSTTYLYLYPVFHACAFPSKDGSRFTALKNTFINYAFQEDHDVSTSDVPIFRLLVLADPQIEGDSSLPDPSDALIPTLMRHWATISDPRHSETRKEVIGLVASEIIHEDIPRALYTVRKQLDLFGNDFYLAHIYRTLHWWTKPTHVTVLGDLIGSQWVTDEEFSWRGWRYWNRVFAGGIKTGSENVEGGTIPQGLDQTNWTHKIINIAGNHDIGYAGDISGKRLERYESMFGPANWDLRFLHPNPTGNATLQNPPSLHLVVLNSLSLDGPPLSEDISKSTYEFINSVIDQSQPVEDRSSFTLLLTHVPLHKPEGVCVDAPFFNYWDHDDNENRYKRGHLREQNHLSEHISHNGILQGIFGMSKDENAAAGGKGRNGLILTGHDHEGCDTWHHVPRQANVDSDSEATIEPSWHSTKYQNSNISNAHTGIREVTLRSMMGAYGGNAGLLSAWFDFELGEWQYDIQMCGLGVQHIWWAVHVVDLICVVLGIVAGLLTLFEKLGTGAGKVKVIGVVSTDAKQDESGVRDMKSRETKS